MNLILVSRPFCKYSSSNCLGTRGHGVHPVIESPRYPYVALTVLEGVASLGFVGCGGEGQKWLRKSEQGDEWNRCLIEGMIVLSETGARDEQTTPP